MFTSHCRLFPQLYLFIPLFYVCGMLSLWALRVHRLWGKFVVILQIVEFLVVDSVVFILFLFFVLVFVIVAIVFCLTLCVIPSLLLFKLGEEFLIRIVVYIPSLLNLPCLAFDILLSFLNFPILSHIPLLCFEIVILSIAALAILYYLGLLLPLLPFSAYLVTSICRLRVWCKWILTTLGKGSVVWCIYLPMFVGLL